MNKTLYILYILLFVMLPHVSITAQDHRITRRSSSNQMTTVIKNKSQKKRNEDKRSNARTNSSKGERQPQNSTSNNEVKGHLIKTMFNCNVSKAKLYIDSELVGRTSCELLLEPDIYLIAITADGYEVLRQKITVDKNNYNFYFNLKRNQEGHNATTTLSANRSKTNNQNNKDSISFKMNEGDYQFRLGHKYEYGDGVKRSYEKAVQCYLQAANLGHSEAQCNLGFMYEHGRGVQKNINEAIKWYRKAAAQNNNIAKYKLEQLNF